MSEARSLKLAEEIESMTEHLPQIQSKSEAFGFDFQKGEPIPDNGKFDWKQVSPPSVEETEQEKATGSAGPATKVVRPVVTAAHPMEEIM